MQTGLNNNSMDDEITLGQIVGFFVLHWKKIILSMILGGGLGLIGASLLGKYKAEVILVNNHANGSGLDFLTWNSVQKEFPALATQLINQKKINDKNQMLYESFRDSKWWQKNVSVNYALSKSEMKDFAVIGDDLQKKEAQSILSLVITGSGKDRQTALDNVKEATTFIQNGFIYIGLRNLLEGYEAEILSRGAEINKRLADLDLQKKYLVLEEKNLELLSKRFPKKDDMSSSKIADFKESNAKYMPLNTQLIAVNIEINQLEENVKKLEDQREQLNLLQQFLPKARQNLDQQKTAAAFIESLLQNVTQLEVKYPSTNLNNTEVLSRIRNDVVAIDTRFNRSLIVSTPVVTKSSKILPLIVGMLLGALVAIIYQLLAISLRVEANPRPQ